MIAIAIVRIDMDMWGFMQETSDRFPQGSGGKTLEDVEKRLKRSEPHVGHDTSVPRPKVLDLVTIKKTLEVTKATAEDRSVKSCHGETDIDVHAAEPSEDEESHRLEVQECGTLSRKKRWVGIELPETRNEVVDMKREFITV